MSAIYNVLYAVEKRMSFRRDVWWEPVTVLPSREAAEKCIKRSPGPHEYRIVEL